jgi:hypothetical protein
VTAAKGAEVLVLLGEGKDLMQRLSKERLLEMLRCLRSEDALALLTGPRAALLPEYLATLGLPALLRCLDLCDAHRAADVITNVPLAMAVQAVSEVDPPVGASWLLQVDDDHRREILAKLRWHLVRQISPRLKNLEQDGSAS